MPYLNARRFLIFWLSLGVIAINLVTAAERQPPLAARESGVPVFAQQDDLSDRIGTLEKGEALAPLAEAVGQQTWYMIRTKTGLTGWVRASDVAASNQIKDSFKEKDTDTASSTWAAVNSDGRTFDGTWSLSATPSTRSASGRWGLRDSNGSVVARGTWTAEMHATGWNGTWRASAEGRQNEYRGSWSVEMEIPRTARFSELFEAAAKDAIHGLWTGGHESGTWSIRVVK
jgi:hypothetical protein